MNEQIKKDYETLKNWEQKLLDQFSPTGAIKGLEVQGNNLIISFESEVPGDFQLTTGAPIQAVGDLLAAQERVTRGETKKYVDDIICDWGMNLEINADEVMDLRKDINLI